MKTGHASFARLWLPALIVLAVGLALPLFITSGYTLRIVMLVWLYAILGMSFNLIFGLTGQLTLGQQGFFAIGAYSMVLMQTGLGLPLVAALPLGLLACALLGVVIGLPVLRLRSHYLAMATLAFGLILEGVALRWADVTGGSAGIRVPQLEILGLGIGRTSLYYILLGFAALAFLVQAFIMSTHVGRALQGIRDDESAAEALGINAIAYKVKIFALGAVFAGLAGISYALVSRHVDPSYSAISINVNILTIAVVGGLGTRLGPFLGAAFVVLMPQFLTRFGHYEVLFHGVFLLLFLIFLPKGLAGLIESGGFTRRRRGQAGEAGADAATTQGAR